MPRPICVRLGLALLIAAPMLPMLGHGPQNPDGAEMISVALHGGNLHPSGMPLQLWLNRLAVGISPFAPGFTLSLVSWLGLFVTLTLLLSLADRLRWSWPTRIFAGLILAYQPIVWTLALQPEKYTWLAATLTAAILAMTGEGRRWGLIAGLACGLAVAQHSSALILWPALFIVLILRRRPVQIPVAGLAAMAVAAAGHATLLWARADRPWPDWGHLETLTDVWHHFWRRDYGLVNLLSAPIQGPQLTGLELLGESLRLWHVGALFIPLGLIGLWRERRDLAMALLSALGGALFILHISRLPSFDLVTATGYAERYQVLALPMLVILAAAGGESLLRGSRARHAGVLLIMAATCAWPILRAWPVAQAVDNEIPRIFREEVARLMPRDALFVSNSDFELFDGIPCAAGTCFPVKNLFGFAWFRDRAAARIDSRLPDLFAAAVTPDGAWDYGAFLRRAFADGHILAMTSAAPVLDQPELMAAAEHRGLLWVFRKGQSTRYTDEIWRSTARLCARLMTTPRALPRNGLHFAANHLEQFHYAFKGAADAWLNAGRRDHAAVALDAANAMVPGAPVESWRFHCRRYLDATGESAP